MLGLLMMTFVLLSGTSVQAARQSETGANPKQAGKSPVKVFILAGQSNMEGQGNLDMEDQNVNNGKGSLAYVMRDPSKAALFKHLKDAKGAWVVRDDVWCCFNSISGLKVGGLAAGFTGYEGKHHFGPELQFGHVVGDCLDNQVLIIKTAWGGKNLNEDFRPPGSGGQVGPFYKKMIQEVQEALTELKKNFPAYDGGGYELAGFVWWHGWNDFCDNKSAVPAYEQNLVNLISDVRKDLKAPKLPVVIGEFTGPWLKDSKSTIFKDPLPAAAVAIRKAQANAAARPEFKGSVLFVETHDFVRLPEESPCPGHGHHEFANGETYFLVGDALGKGMVSLLKK